jgi:hypothetical protein
MSETKTKTPIQLNLFDNLWVHEGVLYREVRENDCDAPGSACYYGVCPLKESYDIRDYDDPNITVWRKV